jgi:hypothetical protein
MRPVIAALAVLCFYGLFYRYVVARWGPAVQWAIRGLGLDARRPVREVEAVGKLAAAGVAQLLFAFLLAWWVGLPAGVLVGRPFEPGILAAAAVLGAGELALTSLICTVIVELAVAAAPGSGEETARRWTARTRGGWMSFFLLTARAAPSALTMASVCLYVVVEELIFRGILVTAFSGWGAAAAVCGSAALFVTVQAFGMPSRPAALFPMVGATVIGVVHGVLFWLVPAVAPLALAHVAFFAAALSLTAARAEPSLR